MTRFRLVFLLLCLSCASTAPPEVTVPLPGSYAIILENDSIVAMQHQILAGSSEPRVSRPRPFVRYAVNGGRLTRAKQTVEIQPGYVEYREPGPEQLENPGDQDLVFIEVELKKDQRIGLYVAEEDDAVRLAPEVYHLLLENDRVRVFEIRSIPGHRTAMHSHPGLAFRFRMNNTRSRLILADGTVMESDAPAGIALWTEDPQRHALENIGETPSRTLLVEVR